MGVGGGGGARNVQRAPIYTNIFCFTVLSNPFIPGHLKSMYLTPTIVLLPRYRIQNEASLPGSEASTFDPAKFPFMAPPKFNITVADSPPENGNGKRRSRIESHQFLGSML